MIKKATAIAYTWIILYLDAESPPGLVRPEGDVVGVVAALERDIKTYKTKRDIKTYKTKRDIKTYKTN